MAMPSAAEAAQKWATALPASQQRYIDGVNSVNVAPGTLAARAAPVWAANTAAAQGRFARNSAAVSLQAWQQATTTKGAQRLASGAQAAQPKMEAALAKLFPAIASAVSSLPPRGDIEANIARSAQYARTMNKYKTQGS
jgi:hypothetical protein